MEPHSFQDNLSTYNLFCANKDKGYEVILKKGYEAYAFTGFNSIHSLVIKALATSPWMSELADTYSVL